ncbi:RNA-binding protein 7 [Aricia agestis]|uniref:RNA-binding protein 7 n=1 Tax=Aricia agestis TaxID=91739 RepID=UPI001C206D49|nr:RNA-binding protein 7 [Aricia agestis]XP_041985945.1 RNA-binding protein 7 [Aricia agestis]
MIDEDTKTLWCGNLADQVTEEVLYELFLQAGPLEKVKIPRDRDGRQKNFAFITYCHEVSVPYALNLFRGTALFYRTLNLQSKGRMVMLPPPIRCYGLEMPMNFQNQDNVAQHFLEMTERLKQENPLMYSANQPQESSHDVNQHAADNLVMASLQGNWSHRHHPYRPKDQMHSRDIRHNDSNDYRRGESRDNHDYRYSDTKDRDDYKSRSKHSGSWRERRNHRSRR